MDTAGVVKPERRFPGQPDFQGVVFIFTVASPWEPMGL